MDNSRIALDMLERHKQVIAGENVSLNRRIDPLRLFVRAKGAYIWGDFRYRQFLMEQGIFHFPLLTQKRT